MSKLFRPHSLLMELIRRFDGDAGCADDQIMRIQKPVDTGLGDKVVPGVSEPHRKLAWRQLGFFQSQFHNLITYLVGDAVSSLAGPCTLSSRPVAPRDR